MREPAKLISFILVLGSAAAIAADPPVKSALPARSAEGQAAPNVDNSAMNVRDKGGATRTAQKQSNSPADRKLVANIRGAVVRDRTLSTAAHNVKIVASGGAVTLRGPVRSADESAKIEALAQQAAGVTSVENKLDVKTN